MQKQIAKKPYETLRAQALTTWGHDDTLAKVRSMKGLIKSLDRLIVIAKQNTLFKLRLKTLTEIRAVAVAAT